MLLYCATFPFPLLRMLPNLYQHEANYPSIFSARDFNRNLTAPTASGRSHAIEEIGRSVKVRWEAVAVEQVSYKITALDLRPWKGNVKDGTLKPQTKNVFLGTTGMMAPLCLRSNLLIWPPVEILRASLFPCLVASNTIRLL